jgi:hypothetical protein
VQTAVTSSKALLLLGCAACSQQAQPWVELQHELLVVRNVSEAEITLSIASSDPPLDCDQVASLAPNAPLEFEGSHEESLAYGDRVVLADPEQQCGAALLSSARLVPTVAAWDLRGIDVEERRSVDIDEIPLASVYLERWGTELRPAVGRGIRVVQWD